MKGKIIKDETGSVSIEFMGLLPFIIIILVVFVQILMSGYSILMAQKAAHESAKVYSITGSAYEAEETIRDGIGGGSSLLNYSDFEIETESNGYFTVRFTGQHGIVFGPDSWRSIFELPHQAYSRIIE